MHHVVALRNMYNGGGRDKGQYLCWFSKDKIAATHHLPYQGGTLTYPALFVGKYLVNLWSNKVLTPPMSPLSDIRHDILMILWQRKAPRLLTPLSHRALKAVEKTHRFGQWLTKEDTQRTIISEKSTDRTNETLIKGKNCRAKAVSGPGPSKNHQAWFAWMWITNDLYYFGWGR